VADVADTGHPDLTLMSRRVKEIIRAAGLRDELTFTSFRHGGFTEAADADLSDAEIRAAGATQIREGAATLRQTDDETGRRWHQEAPRQPNKRRTFVRMSNSTLVRTAQRT
jgi:hypothetical protein